MRLASVCSLFALTAAAACTQLDSGPDPTGGKVCTSGRVIAGDPRSSSSDTTWDPAGHPARAEPPMHFGNLARRGDVVLTSTGRSIWRIDLAAAAPTFVRVAGDDGGDTVFHPTGPCAGVRFFAAEGLAWLDDGRLIVGDDWANAVIELSDPLSPACTARVIAGTARDLTTSDNTPGHVYMPGDVDGPGAGARIAAPDDAIAGAGGDVYVWDRGNRKIKRIAGDAARTVSTAFALGDALDTVTALAFVDGALYAGGINFDGTRVIRIDPATGTSAPVVNAADVEGPGEARPIAITGDGADLVVYAAGGFVYRVGAGGAITRVAGFGDRNTDLTDADYAGDIPAMDVPLHFVDGFVGGGNLVMQGGHLLVPSFDAGWGLWDFTCE